MVFQTLSKLKSDDDLHQATLVILQAGNRMDRKIILGSQITQIEERMFLYKEQEQEKRVPNHRVIEIRFQGESLWRRS